MFVDEVEQGGSINENEGSLLRSAIEFNDVQVEDILTHRVDIEAVDVDESKGEIAKIFTESGHSRLPVYEETIDDIIGIIHHKDFYTDGGITEHSVREIMTKPIFIPPTLKISNLLKLLQKEKTYMAVVTDEYGGTLGIVTMEDILEELVGEIWDEHDEIVEKRAKTRRKSIMTSTAQWISMNFSICLISRMKPIHRLLTAGLWNTWEGFPISAINSARTALKSR